MKKYQKIVLGGIGIFILAGAGYYGYGLSQCDGYFNGVCKMKIQQEENNLVPLKLNLQKENTQNTQNIQNTQNLKNKEKRIKKIYSEEIKNLNPKDYILIDVRTAREFQAGHIINSINISHENIAQSIEKTVPNKNTKIIVYCRSGNRS